MGATAAARLRRISEEVEIVLVERGEHISFANCGLPYYIGETIKDRKKMVSSHLRAMERRLFFPMEQKSKRI
ncbi:hypothetical protein [Bacillus sp. UNC438CL73TsuS30]|uniref:hypothetical protein n=1 Tax=Bacillus sp. UNC438CL73TsuS30 TaxID=1340434 RepID=UPI000A461271|nr:hypothetical protein [Bacillus sp. UNC438CL73TsuS30]